MQKNSITNKITPCCGLPFSVIYWWISNLTLNSESDRQFILSKISQNGILSIDGWKVLINSGTLEADASLTKPDFLAWFDCNKQPTCEQLKLIIEAFEIGNWMQKIEQIGGDISISDIVETPNYSVLYFPSEFGIYPNAGNLAFNEIDGVVYFIWNGTEWKKINYPFQKQLYKLSNWVKGNTGNDATEKIQDAIDFTSNLGVPLYIDANSEWLIKSHIDGYVGNYLRDQGGVKLKSNTTLIFEENAVFKAIPTSQPQYNILHTHNAENIKIYGGKIYGERNEHTGTTGEWGYGLAIQGSRNIYVEKTEFYDCWGDGINIQVIHTPSLINCADITMRDVICKRNRRQGMSIEDGTKLSFYNCEFSETGGTAPACGVDIEPWYELAPVKDVIFDGCRFKNNDSAGILAMTYSSHIKVLNSFFEDNRDIEGQLKTFFNAKNLLIQNNTFIQNNKDNQFIFTGVSVANTEDIVMRGNTFINANIKFNVSDNDLNEAIIVDANYFKFSHRVYELFFQSPIGTGGVLALTFTNNYIDYSDYNYPDNELTLVNGVAFGELKNSTISNNTFINTKRVSFRGKKNIFQNNIIDLTIGNGLVFYGEKNIVQNNVFKGIGYLDSYGYGMNIYGKNHIIKGNYFFKFSERKPNPTNTISVGFLANTDNELIDIYDNDFDISPYVKYSRTGGTETNRYVQDGKLLNDTTLFKKVGDIMDIDGKTYICYHGAVFNANNSYDDAAKITEINKQAVSVGNSTATDTAGIVNDFNSLVQKLKDAGLIKQ